MTALSICTTIQAQLAAKRDVISLSPAAAEETLRLLNNLVEFALHEGGFGQRLGATEALTPAGLAEFKRTGKMPTTNGFDHDTIMRGLVSEWEDEATQEPVDAGVWDSVADRIRFEKGMAAMREKLEQRGTKVEITKTGDVWPHTIISADLTGDASVFPAERGTPVETVGLDRPYVHPPIPGDADLGIIDDVISDRGVAVEDTAMVERFDPETMRSVTEPTGSARLLPEVKP